MSRLEDKIKAIAAAAGFHHCGLTSLSHLDAGERAVRDWTGRGLHGSMKYLEDIGARRERFLGDFPEAKSVIALGVNYFSETPPENVNVQLNGKVARYAWGRDYHQIIKKKHMDFIAELEKFAPGLKAKSCVDIQPVPEKWMAKQAGLGFVGKNTVLLSRKYGPWVFLSEIVTDLELAEDSLDTGSCGVCAECQTSCPTGALHKDYEMDARLCIASLTIEHKGIIPRDMRPKIQDWVFGCDICLDVCPFSSKSKNTDWEEFSPEAGAGPKLGLEELFELETNSAYEKKFQGTALLRAGRKQMLRNACVVLGNSGDPKAVPWLKKALGDAAWLVRLHAAWALGRLALPDGLFLLEQALGKEEDPRVREEIITSLKQTP